MTCNEKKDGWEDYCVDFGESIGACISDEYEGF